MKVAGRPMPTTFECIEAIALREPDRLALVQGGQRWTYNGLYLDLLKVSVVLHDIGVKRGHRVAVGTSGLQASLLLLLAAESLGAVTTAFLPEGDPDAQAVFALVDWVISDRLQQVPAPARSVTLDAAFLERMQAADVAAVRNIARVAPGPDEPQRISRTSGSSGRSKFMLLSRQAQEWWIASCVSDARYHAATRLLVIGPLVMNGIFARCAGCLRIGAAVIDGDSFTGEPRASDLYCLPVSLELLMRGMKHAQHPINVLTAGAHCSADLRARSQSLFGSPLQNRYGTNETGMICEEMDSRGIGVLSAGVEARIVDDAWNDLREGETGIIAVRTPGMADGYLNDSESTAKAFRHGWFMTGDRGTLLWPRVLQLAGRSDDLVNFGGIKVPAARIEAQVRALAQPLQCAVQAVNLDAGNTGLGIAVVIAPDAARDSVRRTLAQGLQLDSTTGVRILFLDELPRMGNGKVDRLALHRLFASPPTGSS
jgi:acyl-coenzyme A synthetase/AMP-(fatty) acid ligase